jgi:hypothetical protein
MEHGAPKTTMRAFKKVEMVIARLWMKTLRGYSGIVCKRRECHGLKTSSFRQHFNVVDSSCIFLDDADLFEHPMCFSILRCPPHSASPEPAALCARPSRYLLVRRPRATPSSRIRIRMGMP